MAYCDVLDVKMSIPERELINLTVDEPRADSAVNDELLGKIISLSDEVVDGYLRSRYTLPITPVPQLIKAISIDIVVYRLYARRPQKITESVKENYEKALKLLEQIQKGLITLAIDSKKGEEVMHVGFCRTNKTKADKIYSAENLRAY